MEMLKGREEMDRLRFCDAEDWMVMIILLHVKSQVLRGLS